MIYEYLNQFLLFIKSMQNKDIMNFTSIYKDYLNLCIYDRFKKNT